MNSLIPVGNKEFMESLVKLDAEQRKAVLAKPGTLRIIAGAGTGKTTALTHRIAYWHHEGSMPANKVLAMTHSNKAAKELRKRLAKLGISDVTAKTFHALAWQLLRDNWSYWQGSSNIPELLKDTEQYFSIKSITERILKRKTQDGRFVREFDRALSMDIRAELNLCRSRMIKPEDYLKNLSVYGPGNGLTRQDFFEIYDGYTRMKRSRNAIDFADQLEFAIDMLEGMEDIRAKVQKRYAYFYIDEYQDIDPVQERLLTLIRGESKCLSVVGDPRQTIYSFKGSEPKFLVEFESYHKGATSVELARNYRSTAKIVEHANNLMRNSTASGGAKLELVPTKVVGSTPTIEEFEAQNNELAGLVSKIRRYTDFENIEPSEIAILVRINSNIPVIRAYLGKAGIDTKSPGDNFWEDIMPLLNRFHSAFTDETDLKGMELLKQTAIKSNWWREEFLEGMSQYRFDLTEALLTLALQVDPDESLKPEELLSEFTKMKDEYIDDDDTNVVTVTSVHKAKGLEWDCVLLPMFIDGQYPISLAKTQDEIDEEQRVLYVAITRPRKNLALTWSKQANLYNRKQFVSRFASRLRYSNVIQENAAEVSARRQQQAQSLNGLKVGDRVNHQKHGLGKIMNIEGNFLEINFGKVQNLKLHVESKDLEKL
jgi:DNA helicase II / ATP-dependent DNA helicase PcrA